MLLPLIMLVAAQSVPTQLALDAHAGYLVPSLPEFAALQRSRQTLTALERRCAATHAQHTRAYRSLERVVVFEGTAAWPTQGIGTLLWWYTGAFKVGLETGRAAFFSNGYGAAPNPSTTSEDAYEINRDFHAETFDGSGQLINWNWADASVRANVSATMRARHGLARADAVIDCYAPCHNSLHEYKVTRNDDGHAAARTAAPAAHGGASFARPAHLCDRRTQRREAPAAEARAGVYPTLLEALRSIADARWVSVRLWAREIGSPVSKWSSQWLAVQPSSLDGFDCAVAAILRPAPHIQQALLPLMRAASGERADGGAAPALAAGPLVAVHVRTLSLDIVTLARIRRHSHDAIAYPAPRCEHWKLQRQAALLGLAPRTKPSVAWQLFDEMADDACRPCASAPVPTPALCAGLPGQQGKAAGGGALTRLLSCALARSTARAGSAAHALNERGSVFLATDSPGLVSLIGSTAWLKRRVLLSDKSPAHVQCDRTRARDHDSCDSVERRRDAAVKSAVDLVMLASADVVAQYSASTFFGAAVAANPHLAPDPLSGRATSTPRGVCERRVWSRRPADCNASVEVQLEAWQAMFDDRCAELTPRRRAESNQRRAITTALRRQ